jgi:hypothetical protein
MERLGKGGVSNKAMWLLAGISTVVVLVALVLAG